MFTIHTIALAFGGGLVGTLVSAMLYIRYQREHINEERKLHEMLGDTEKNKSATAAIQYADTLFEEAGYPECIHIYFDMNEDNGITSIHSSVMCNSEPQRVIQTIPGLLSKVTGQPVTEMIALNNHGESIVHIKATDPE